MSVRTFAESAAARDAQWIVIVQIEGSGDGAGTVYKYCTERPSYADSSYRDWIVEWPRVTAERVDVLGGVPESGELELVLLDFNDTLTNEWRIEASPFTYLSGAIDADDSPITLRSTTGLVANTSKLYCGNEAITVDSVGGGGSVTVGRGKLQTDATKHPDGAPVYLYLPYLHSRRAAVYIVNKDAASAVQEKLVGEFRIDQFELSEDFNSYVLRGKSQLKWLSRLTARRPQYRTIVQTFREGEVGAIGSGVDFSDTPVPNTDTAFGAATIAAWPNARHYRKNKTTGEIFIVSHPQIYVWDRGMLGTRPAEIKPGDELVVVFGADPSATINQNPTFFRYSPGPSPSLDRATGTWTKSANWIDLILNLIVSSADPDDGLELTNRNDTYGNWSCLPIGIGIGVPHAQVDWAAALAVRARTPDFVFPNFHIGDEPTPLADLITDHFLKPIGAYLSTVGGTARIILPRLPLAGDTAIAIGPDDILNRKVSEGLYQHRMGASQDMSTLASAIVYKVGPRGDRIVVQNGDFGGTFGQGGYYAHDERHIEIEAKSARADSAGRCPFLEDRAQARLRRSFRPAWALSIPVDYSHHARAVGDAIGLTHGQMPNLAEGTRGWSSVQAELTQVGFKVAPEEGHRYDWKASSFGPNFRAGKIAPAARIVQVVDPGGGNYDITVSANRYTQTDALGGLPTNDAAAFAVNDVIKLFNRVGTEVTATTQTIVSITGNVIRVNGNFGGSLTAGAGNAGQIMRYTKSSSAAAQQTDVYVYWADLVARTVGSGSQTPWRYAEP